MMADDEGLSLLDIAEEAPAQPAPAKAETEPTEPPVEANEEADTADGQSDEPQAEASDTVPQGEPQAEAQGAELQRELRELRERLAHAEGALSQVNAPKPEPEVDPYEALLNDPKFVEAFENDPAGATQAKLAQMASVFKERETALREFAEAEARRSDPDWRAAQEVYESLSSQPWFQSLDEQAKMGAAMGEFQRRKEQGASTPAAPTAPLKPQPRPPTTAPVQRKVVEPKKPLTPIERFGEEVFRRAGGIQTNGVLETLNG